MAKIFIDNVPYEVNGGHNLLEACLSLGMDLTYFCWHPALRSVGACRQCAILKYRDENDTKGRIMMACMEPASDNTRISIASPQAVKFRAANVEALMINHPHDCPVCDEGGECHLQDMTLMSGHNYRRYRFKKRTYNNQYLGPFINHEMNRCIQCYRCVRYYNDYAGGTDFSVFAAHDDVYFGRYEPGTLESPFSGNLVEVCPTGVFTDKTLKKHYTRKWDLRNAPSICQQCGLGCNILAGERYGTLRRIHTRFNGDVNGYFLCDRGRYGYEYVNSEARTTRPVKKGSTGDPATGALLRELNALAEGGDVIGIGSPRASLESNFLLRELVGEENFYAGIPAAEGKLMAEIVSVLKDGRVKTPSMKEAESYDVVFIIGEDVTDTAPMLSLSLRQSAKNQPRQKALDMKIAIWNDAAIREVVQGDKGPFFVATPAATDLDDIATGTFHGAPADIARFAQAVAARINSVLPGVQLDEQADGLARTIAEALLSAKKPLIVSGTGLCSTEVVHAAANLALALKDMDRDPGLIYTVPEVNSTGLALLTGRFLEDAFSRTKEASVKGCFILENNLYTRTDKADVDAFLQQSGQVVVLDSLVHETVRKADFVLPAGTFAESDGTVVNNEGRAQRFYQVYVPEDETRSSWNWLDAVRLGSFDGTRHFDEVVDSLTDALPELEAVKELAPPAGYRKGTQKIPREPHRYSGRTAMDANKHVSEPRPPSDPDSALSYSMEGYFGRPPSSLIPFFWSPGWNSIQAVNKFQIEVGGPLHGGNPGKRLFEPSSGQASRYFTDIPQPFGRRQGQWLVLPFYHVFGSDELSSLSSPIQERMPAPYIALNEQDASEAGLAEGQELELMLNGAGRRLAVKLVPSLPRGTAGIPKGFGELQGLVFPFWIDLNGAKDE